MHNMGLNNNKKRRMSSSTSSLNPSSPLKGKKIQHKINRTYYPKLLNTFLTIITIHFYLIGRLKYQEGGFS